MKLAPGDLPLLDPHPDAPFPDAGTALRHPDGLLALGGDLSPPRLLNAYRHGIFPWFSAGQPLLWWSPDPRTVLRTDGIHLSSRFRRSLRKSSWVISADQAFEAVIAGCAHAPRAGQQGTWITPGMQQAYQELHDLGHAHSIEVREGTELVGGLYGVAIGRMFFGESMFGTASGASKVALAGLALRLHGWGWPLIDAQVENDHLMRLGARRWPRPAFLHAVRTLTAMPGADGKWTELFGALPARLLAA